jgi:transposase
MNICYSRFKAERGRPKKPMTVGDDDPKVLEAMVRRRTTAQALAQRAGIILACAEGISNKEAAARCGVWPQTVSKWRKRFVEKGIDGLSDGDRPGRPRTITDDQVEDLVVRTLEERPPDGGTHWSTRHRWRSAQG